MDGDEPTVGDEMTEEGLPAEEPVTENAIPDITEEPDPFVQQMAANIADELDKEQGPSEEDPTKALREMYEEAAAKSPLVQEVIQGLTTFKEALEEIITEMYKVGDEPSLREFVHYYNTLNILLGGTVLETDEAVDLFKFCLLHSEKASKKFRRDQILWGGSSAVALGAGQYLVRQPKYMQLGLILRAVGMGGVGSTALAELTYGLRGHKLGKKTAAMRELLYAAADALDTEVRELFAE